MPFVCDFTDQTPGQPPPVPDVNPVMLDNVKKCKNFLSTLIKLAASQPPETVQNVKNLIQGLIVSASVPHC